MMRVALLAAVVVAVAVAYLASRDAQAVGIDVQVARAALSPLDGAVRVPGLKDGRPGAARPWGVPHIYAQSTEDLFFAQGYVMAQDRLWQMEIWRRAAEGRLAEVLGAARGCRAIDRRGCSSTAVPWMTGS